MHINPEKFSRIGCEGSLGGKERYRGRKLQLPEFNRHKGEIAYRNTSV